ncbi:MMPL family transporter [Candidatus Aenigmatarchaeota archaeon]
MIENLLEKVARVELKRPKLVIAVFMIVTVIFMSGFPLIKSETNFDNFIPENDVIKNIYEIADKLGTGTASIILIFQGDINDPNAIIDMRDRDILLAIDMINKQIEKNEFVLSSISVIDYVEENGVIYQQNKINEKLSDNENVSSLLSDDYLLSVSRFTIPDGLTQGQQEDLISEIKKIISFSEKPRGLTVTPAGAIVQELEIGKSIGENMAFVTILGFIGVFIVLFIIFRRFSFVGVAVIPVIFGTLWTNGAMGLVGIPFSTALVGVFSLIIGIGIDFAIHIIHRFEEEVKKNTLEEAIDAAVKRVGKGLAMTTTTTVLGFLALLAAELPILHDMALALSMGVLFTFVATIGLIPPILVIIERRRQGKRKKKSFFS